MFVFMDISKYGSKRFVKKYFVNLKDMTSFLRNAYRGKIGGKWFKDVVATCR